MILSKTGLAIAVSALLFSGSSLAFNGVDDGDGNAQWDDSLNTTNVVNDSFKATDNSTDVGVNDSFKATDNRDQSTDLGVNGSFNDDNDTLTNTTTNTTTNTSNDNDLGIGIADSFKSYDNDYTDNSDTLNVGIDDSFNDNSTDDSYNTSNSYNTLSVSTDMVVASSTLSGTAAGLVINTAWDDEAYVNVTNINSLDGMDGVAGITTVGQIAGSNSLVQQSVVTNANLFTGE
jgi:hypothetical protein